MLKLLNIQDNIIYMHVKKYQKNIEQKLTYFKIKKNQYFVFSKKLGRQFFSKSWHFSCFMMAFLRNKFQEN